MLAAICLFGVEWVGDKDPALEQLGPLLGSLFVAIAAVFAATVAARTAKHRQREQLNEAESRLDKQLSHDKSRHREEVVAAEDRLSTQLRHDRAMRDREFLRHTVNSVLGNVLEAMAHVNGLSGSEPILAEMNRISGEVERLARKAEGTDDEGKAFGLRATMQDKQDEIRETWNTRRASADTHLKTAFTDSIRLRSILGTSSAPQKAHLELTNAIQDWRDAVVKLKEGAPDDDLANAAKEAQERIAPALTAFEKACGEELDRN